MKRILLFSLLLTALVITACDNQAVKEYVLGTANVSNSNSASKAGGGDVNSGGSGGGGGGGSTYTPTSNRSIFVELPETYSSLVGKNVQAVAYFVNKSGRMPLIKHNSPTDKTVQLDAGTRYLVYIDYFLDGTLLMRLWASVYTNVDHSRAVYSLPNNFKYHTVPGSNGWGYLGGIFRALGDNSQWCYPDPPHTFAAGRRADINIQLLYDSNSYIDESVIPGIFYDDNTVIYEGGVLHIEVQ